MFRGGLPRVTLASLRGNGLSLQLFRGQVTPLFGDEALLPPCLRFGGA